MARTVRYFSVESRKGGVGKTTAALNLSKLLLKNYSVVLLDCDVTGTSVSHSVDNSPFWEGIANVIKADNGNDKANLLSLFNEYCKSGKEDTFSNLVDSFKDKKINIIGSELYGQSGLITDPRQIMDDLHSYWFLDMIKFICDKAFQEQNKNVAIVIDNSPGYVGLGRAIHEWLTALGPDSAHFLLVSSLDEQDLKSSLDSAIEIERLMSGKVRAKNYYVDLLNNSDIDSEMESFLDEKENTEIKRYFYSLSDCDFQLERQDIPDMSSYLSIIFNKIAEECIDDCTTYDASYLNDAEKQVYDELVKCNNAGFPLPVIPYETQINTQFFESHLSNNKAVDKSYWENLFYDLSSEGANSRILGNHVKQAYTYSTRINDLRESLSSHGFRTLSKDTRNEWIPSYPLNELRNLVSQIIYFYKPNYSNLSKGGSKDEMLKYSLQLVEDVCSGPLVNDYYFLIQYVSEFVYTAVKSKSNEVKQRQSTTIAVFLNVFLNVFESRIDDFIKNSHEISFRYYLASEYQGKPIDLLAYIEILGLNDIRVDDNTVVKVFDYSKELSAFGQLFYRSMVYCILRLIDLDADYHLLVNVYRNQVLQKRSRFISSEIKKYLDSAITRKQEKPDSDKLNKKYSAAMNMYVFENVLSKYAIVPWKV